MKIQLIFALVLAVGHGVAQAESTTVHAILEGVERHEDGSLTAVFGYQNDGSTAVIIAPGEANKLTPPLCEVPVTTFEPGRVHAAFRVPFESENLVWTLQSPDGSRRTSTASRDSQLYRSSEAESAQNAPTPPAKADGSENVPVVPDSSLNLPPMPVENLPVVPSAQPMPTDEPEAAQPAAPAAPMPTPTPVPTPFSNEMTVPDAQTEPQPEASDDGADENVDEDADEGLPMVTPEGTEEGSSSDFDSLDEPSQ